MLHRIQLHGVGPSEDLTLAPLGSRINLLTGDNGLGKSFLLEAAWWALTRTWHEHPAVPSQPDAKIEYEFDGDTTRIRRTWKWDPSSQQWKGKQGRPPNPGLVMYARVDGSFSVWDPYRNYRLYKRADGGEAESPAAYQFAPRQVLDGLHREVLVGGLPRQETLCLGLIDQWREWQRSGDKAFDLLRSLLGALGPDGHPLVPGALVRPTLDDVREIPTIRTPYGQDVPITYAPAGVRRMCKLAYLFAWALREHKIEAERLGKAPSKQFIVLVDELETHLHPRWQRTVLPSLLTALTQWSSEVESELQLVLATHSPLILTSIEPVFDRTRDALWKLDLVGDRVVLERDEWHKRGDAVMWLESDVFDETLPYSREAERAMNRASALMSGAKHDGDEVRATHEALVQVLADNDPFWLHWHAWSRSRSTGG